MSPSTTANGSSSSSGPARFHLFGYPIAHSASPTFQNACFGHLGRGDSCKFEGWSTSKIDQAMLDEIRGEHFGGAAVTMPLKTAILDHLDELTPASRATNACNTIVRVSDSSKPSGYKLVGTNTDTLGVRNSLLRTLRAQHSDRELANDLRFAPGTASGCVVGGGATTRSAVYALHTIGLNPIFLINRDPAEVQAVVDSFKTFKGEQGESIDLVHLRGIEDVDRYLGTGESGQGGEKPGLAMIVGAIPAISPTTIAERMVYTTVVHLLTMPYSPPSASESTLPLPTRRIFLDMAYKPRLTPLLRIASALGWQDVGGIQAMIEQGLAQQRMWKVGRADWDIACGAVEGEGLGADVEKKARELIEGMKDVVPVGQEVDRSLAVIGRN